MQAYGKGPFSEVQTQLVKTGNWESFFGDLPPYTEATKTKINPIAFSLNDFRNQPVKFSNMIKYQSYECSPKEEHKVFIQLVNQYWESTFQINKNGAGFWVLFGMGEGTSGIV